MPRFGRECASKDLTVAPSAPPFSNFAFVEQQFGGLRTLRRILSQARSHLAKTMVIEDIDPDEAEDLREENGVKGSGTVSDPLRGLAKRRRKTNGTRRLLAPCPMETRKQ